MRPIRPIVPKQAVTRWDAWDALFLYFVYRPKIRKSLSITHKKKSVNSSPKIFWVLFFDSIVRFLLVGIFCVDVPNTFSKLPAVKI